MSPPSCVVRTPNVPLHRGKGPLAARRSSLPVPLSAPECPCTPLSRSLTLSLVPPCHYAPPRLSQALSGPYSASPRHPDTLVPRSFSGLPTEEKGHVPRFARFGAALRSLLSAPRSIERIHCSFERVHRPSLPAQLSWFASFSCILPEFRHSV